MRAALFGLALALAPAAVAAQGTTQLIPGDGGWMLTTVPNSGCFARLSGAQVDTVVMVNRDAQPVLSIGRPDWHLGTADMSVGLKINMGPVHQLTVSPADSIVFVLVGDDLREQVLSAKSMTWTLPSGTVTASVAGLDKAFKAVVPCGLAAAKATPPRS